MKPRRKRPKARRLHKFTMELGGRILSVGDNDAGIPEVEIELPLAGGDRKFSVSVPLRSDDARRMGNLLYNEAQLRVEVDVYE